MKTKTFCAVVATSVCVAATASAQVPAATGPGGIPRVNMAPPADAPPPKNNPAGPYAVTVESGPGLPTHTVYRPADLARFKGDRKLPIISWGNGGCINVGTMFSPFLTQVASHGYFAVSIGPKNAQLPAFIAAAEKADQAGEPLPAGIGPPPKMEMSKDQQIIDAIDWAVKENDRKDSPYYQHLDTTKVAVMGQSCGGLQAIAASDDPRVTTSVIWNSGTFAPGTAPMNMSSANKDSLGKLHAPIAYFIGGSTDVAYPNAEDDFKRITSVPVFKANIRVGHGGTFRHPGSGWFGETGVAWLDWQLKGDKQAATYFEGADCKLCKNPLWSVEKKNIK